MIKVHMDLNLGKSGFKTQIYREQIRWLKF